jgi:hypothetical protein
MQTLKATIKKTGESIEVQIENTASTEALVVGTKNKIKVSEINLGAEI